MASPARPGPNQHDGSYSFLTTPPTGATSSKDATAAGILALFFGFIGVHRFYLGYIGVGFAYLGIFFFGVLLGFLVLPAILLFAAAILAIIEGIFLLTGKFKTDALGAELTR